MRRTRNTTVIICGLITTFSMYMVVLGRLFSDWWQAPVLVVIKFAILLLIYAAISEVNELLINNSKKQ